MHTLGYEQVIDRTLVDADGDKLGKVEDVYLDSDTDTLEWALISTGLFGRKASFAPLRGATADGDTVRLVVTKAQVKGAPRVEPGGELSQDEEAVLYRHYGFSYSDARSGSGLPEDGSPVNGSTEPADGSVMTRSEERLRVDTERHEAGRVRLRKHIEVRPVTETVRVSREQVRIERQPVSAGTAAAASDAAFTEEEHELRLTAQRPVVSKEAVPVERVRLATQEMTEQVVVEDTVRSERIEVDADPDAPLHLPDREV